MSLFDVPGWSIGAEPVAESSSLSKKRKRSIDDTDKTTVSDNLEKLVKRLKGTKSQNSISGLGGESKKDKKKRLKEEKREREKEEKKKSISLPKQLRPFADEQVPRKSESLSNDYSVHKHTAKRNSAQRMSVLGRSPAKERIDHDGLTVLQQGMKHSLDGARFRLINETLYKSSSDEACKMIREDPHIFEEYHTGFRRQVQSWPTNPIEHYTTILSRYPSKTVIADLGCGDAALAKGLNPLGLNVLSYDFVSDGAFIVEADICSQLPLPGSEGEEGKKSDGDGHIVDVVVCALSLMGTNWPGCLREAWRVLKPSGELFIAEVASRFTNVEQFQSLVGLLGFKLSSKDDSNTHFTLFVFRKVPRQKLSEKEWKKILSQGRILKACEYKRR
ncbi:hypothetical protein AMATHDRAFT_139028 [Amanita thiersii Skay4041]|uniref:Ribosomal RNA-processing protein 8 n=1 Tax=Amanita thiersii Skay4041 TaxID=703135 RepID=A0A2A9NWX6_9AGAR|nr:hypothetical protein AMATHDRAFT_139028 [Amanita thiersii Skay4041]